MCLTLLAGAFFQIQISQKISFSMYCIQNGEDKITKELGLDDALESNEH